MYSNWTKEEANVLEEVKLLEGKTLVLYNDNHNTFDWVIECLVKICKHTQEQAEQCSLLVHFKGKCSVKEGDLEKLKPMKDSLTEKGLSATIE